MSTRHIVALGGLLAATALGACSSTPAPTPAQTSTVTVTAVDTVTATPTITQTLPAQTVTQTATVTYTPPPPAPKDTFSDGDWTVGQDVNAGVFRLAEPVSGGADAPCYWAIFRTGSNQQDIVANNNVTGGRPQITLHAGQDVESNRCGTWNRVG